MAEPVAPRWFRTTLDSFDPSEPELKEGRLLSTEQVLLEGIVWRKLDRRLLPLCTILFLLSGVDQGNIGNARVAGMQTSLGISNYQYSIALTATYVAYLVAMFPTALLLKHVGPHIILPTLALLYGVVSASQGFVNNFPGLLACRIFIGLSEGGSFTGVVLYLSLFYPRNRLQIRMASLTAVMCVSGAFSGLLAASISRIGNKGGRPGWAWILILEGILTIIFGIACFPILPRSPERTRFLTEKERKYVVSVLKHAGSVSEDDNEDKFSLIEILNTFKSLQTWFLAILVFCNGTILFAFAYFTPTIIDALGYAGNEAQLMSAPPFMAAFVAVLISSIVSDHCECRGYTIIFFSILQLIGFVMFYASTINRVRYASLFFSLSGANCVMPALIAWVSNNSAPYTRRATAVAMITIMAELGAILSAWLLGYLSPAPNYTAATITFIVMSVASVIISMANLGYLWRENRSKEKRRQSMQKEDEPKGLGDRSAWFIYSL